MIVKIPLSSGHTEFCKARSLCFRLDCLDVLKKPLLPSVYLKIASPVYISLFTTMLGMLQFYFIFLHAPELEFIYAKLTHQHIVLPKLVLSIFNLILERNLTIISYCTTYTITVMITVIELTAYS